MRCGPYAVCRFRVRVRVLNTPCSGYTGPPGPQAQAPERTGQSGAETQTVLGCHPVKEKENLALEAENHLMKSAGAVFPFANSLCLLYPT